MVSKRMCFLLVLGILTGLIFVNTPALAQEGLREEVGGAGGASIIAEVLIRGNRTVDESRIRSAARIRVGEEASVEGLRKAIRGVSEMGYFTDVHVEAEDIAGGVRLILAVDEKPLLISLAFSGNKKIKAKNLEEKLDLRPQVSLVDAQTVWEAKQKILDLYHEKGFYSAAVADTFLISGEGATLKLRITEGEKARIKKIEIQGNNAISVRKILAVMKTKKRGWRRAMWVLPAFSAGAIRRILWPGTWSG